MTAAEWDKGYLQFTQLHKQHLFLNPPILLSNTGSPEPLCVRPPDKRAGVVYVQSKCHFNIQLAAEVKTLVPLVYS